MKIIPGQKFGKLTAIKATSKRQHSCVVWECQCDCGQMIMASSRNLSRGATTSCGCFHNGQKNLTGYRFGRLTAIKATRHRQNGSVLWECQCDCGKITIVKVNSLMSGNTKSCGCLAIEHRSNYKKYLKQGPAKNLTGRRFGKIVALKSTLERKNGNVIWECKCDCGNMFQALSHNLIRGSYKSCGHCGISTRDPVTYRRLWARKQKATGMEELISGFTLFNPKLKEEQSERKQKSTI